MDGSKGPHGVSTVFPSEQVKIASPQKLGFDLTLPSSPWALGGPVASHIWANQGAGPSAFAYSGLTQSDLAKFLPK